MADFIVQDEATGAKVIMQHTMPQLQYDIGMTVAIQHPDNEKEYLEGLVVAYNVSNEMTDEGLREQVTYTIQVDDADKTVSLIDVMEEEIEYYYPGENAFFETGGDTNGEETTSNDVG